MDLTLFRLQQVTVNNKNSEWSRVTSGISQGSVLGPLLFVIYINDMPNNIMSNVYLFADDTKLYRVIEGEQDKSKLQDDLLELQNWSNKWLLSFHPDKCKIMRINEKRPTEQYKYYMLKDDEVHHLQTVQSEKDLGVTFSIGIFLGAYRHKN